MSPVRHLARVGLASAALAAAACDAPPVVPPAADALTPASARAWIEATMDGVEVDGETLTASDPQGLAMRIHYGVDMIPLLTGSRDEEAPEPADLPGGGEHGAVLDAYAARLGHLLRVRPVYEAAFFGPRLTLLNDDETKTTRRLWDLAADSLRRIPTPAAVEALAAAAPRQLAREAPATYANALAARRADLRASPRLYRSLARELVRGHADRGSRLRAEPDTALAYARLRAAFLTLEDLEALWDAPDAQGRMLAGLVDSAGYELAAAKADDATANADPGIVGRIRARMIALEGRRLRRDALRAHFPVAAFEDLAGDLPSLADHHRMWSLFLALRGMEFAFRTGGENPDSPAIPSFLGNGHRWFNPVYLGIAPVDGRGQLAGLLERYAAAAPEGSAARDRWMRNVFLAMVLDMPPERLLDEAVLAERPVVPLEAAEGSIARHAGDFAPALRARAVRVLLEKAKRAPSGDALPAARLAIALAQGDAALRGRVDRAIRARWFAERGAAR